MSTSVHEGVNRLQESLEERQAMVEAGTALLRETKELFDLYGKDIFTTTYDRFATLEKSLDSRELRMVVIGEFSRGKSSLLNALLDIKQLPTATEATTAINTFLYGLPSGDTPHLKIIYTNKKEERVEIVNNDQDVLRKWGTELEAENKDARREVERIELYINHPLLVRGLVLIDTPGLESMQEHHEAITHRAIDSAHIAIWVQAATQLGGNQREWEFLRETISRSFRKFITVINWWDKVLEPDDDVDRETIEADRVRKKLNVVRRNFRDNLVNVPTERVEVLTDDENLFGVSARWALNGTDEQKQKSGIDKLAARIEKLCLTDAMDEIIFKPMQQLSSIQDVLENHLHQLLNALENTDSIERQKQDIENLQRDIREVEQELKVINATAKADHERLGRQSSEDLSQNIIEPLQALKEAVDTLLTKDYVRRQIEAHKKNIGLPPELQKEYDEVTGQLNEQLESQRELVQERLEQLRLDYAEAMKKYMGQISTSFASINVDLPTLDVTCELDLSSLENYYSTKMDMENDLEHTMSMMNELEAEIVANPEDTLAIKEAKEAVARMESRIAAHGAPPSPIITEREVMVKEGGMYSSPQYDTVRNVDNSNVRAWERSRAELDRRMQDKEADLERIIAEEKAKSGRRMSAEAALRQRQRELDKLEKTIREMEKKAQQTEATMIEETYERLVRSTSTQLDKYIRLLQKNAREGIASIFAQHLNFLQECVNSQFTEQLKAKENSKSEAVAVLEKGQKELDERKSELAGALNKLAALRERTAEYLQEA